MQPVYILPPSSRSKDPRGCEEKIFVHPLSARLCKFPGPGVLSSSLQCTEPGGGTMNRQHLPCHQHPNDTERWVFPRPTEMKCFCLHSTRWPGCHAALPSFGILFLYLLILVYLKLLLFLNSSLKYK